VYLIFFWDGMACLSSLRCFLGINLLRSWGAGQIFFEEKKRFLDMGLGFRVSRLITSVFVFSFWWKAPKGYMAVELIFVSARTTKRHHHH